MTATTTTKCTLSAAALAAAMLVSSCQSSPTPDNMARTTTEVAPADLQLLCSGAVATAAKTDAAKTLPLSSSKLDDLTYTVEVDAAGTKYSCAVDTSGTVKSVAPAAT
jgi:PBP1b-binding outer membrane lipoprotein LpoB